MRSCIIFILQIALQVFAGDFLNFIPVENANTDENIYLTDIEPTVVIDATSKTSRNIYFLGNNELTTHVVTFSCFTAQRTVALTEGRLCCRPTAFARPECTRLKSANLQGSITCDKLVFNFTYDIHSGATFTMSFNAKKDHNSPYNGFISCSVSDSEARIDSNEIELRDAVFYVNQLGVSTGNDVELTKAAFPPTDFPLSFSCGNFASKMPDWPSWMNAVWHILAPYEWGFCSVGSGTAPVGCAQKRKKFSIGDSETMMDGTLFLLNDRVLTENPNSALICFTRNSGQPIRTFASEFNDPMIRKGISIDINAPPEQLNSLRAMSPLTYKYQFIDGTALDYFNLWAFYRAPVGAAVYPTWYKDSKSITGTDAKKNSLLLPSKVERNLAGIYKLKITSPGLADLEFTYQINVVGPPKFVKVSCIEDLYYIMEGKDQVISCAVGAGKSMIKVGINGFESDTPRGLREMLSGSLELANQPITELDIDFDVNGDDENGRTIILTVRKLRKDQNFRLSIKASNDNGQSQVAGTLRVVPKPVLSIAPNIGSCAEDCNREPYEVHCMADQEVRHQWSQVLNILDRQGWVINRRWTVEALMADPELSPYFEFNSTDPSTIKVSPLVPFSTIKPVEPTAGSSTSTSSSRSDSSPTTTSTNDLTNASNSPGEKKTLQELLDSKTSVPNELLQIECRFRLFVNNPRASFERVPQKGVDSSRRRRSGMIEGQGMIYDSFYDKDENVLGALTAVRTFAEYVPVQTANIAVIATVVVCLIILIIVFAVATWLCTRDKGETYKLYRKECELGNDPLAELKEKETFKVYERSEEPPLMPSRYSLNEDSLKVGSDDEGELEAYIDPGNSPLVRGSYRSRNFNEEASYIGAYAKGPEPAFSNGRSKYDHHTAV